MMRSDTPTKSNADRLGRTGVHSSLPCALATNVEATSATAAMATNVSIKVEGLDKWLTLVQNAEHQKRNRESLEHQ
jgi:hypothetical protein